MITNLLTQAQQLGINVYLKNGQVKVDIPWLIDYIPDEARYVLGELRGRQAEVLATLDTDQERYWRTVLTNAYYLRYPKNGEFESMRELHGVLQKLRELGASLERVESRFERGKIYSFNLRMGSMQWADWNWYQAMVLPRYNEQLDWLLKISVMGAARGYVDLGIELPEEWIIETLGKFGARIAQLREAVIGEIQDRAKGICFKVDDGRIYSLVPGKTGRRITELTPEEAVIVAEAQDTGMLEPGPEGAKKALKWIS